MNKDYETHKRQNNWFGLLDLVHHCPAELLDLSPGASEHKVSVTQTARLVLWTLAFHADGDTSETWVLRSTLMEEVRCDRTTLDRAIAALKRCGLISATQTIGQGGKLLNNIWRINRPLLESLVGEANDDAALESALAAVKRDGECRLRVTPSRIVQTESRLFHLAGDYRIVITEEVVESLKSATLIIRPASPASAEPVIKPTQVEMKQPVMTAVTPVVKPESSPAVMMNKPAPVTPIAEPDPQDDEFRFLIKNYLDALRVPYDRTDFDEGVQGFRRLIDNGISADLLTESLRYWSDHKRNQVTWQGHQECPVAHFIHNFHGFYLFEYRRARKKKRISD